MACYFNTTNTNITNHTQDVLWRADIYSIVVPVLLTACCVTVAFNLLLVTSVRWLHRSLSPTLCFSISLAVANAFASLVVGVGLVINSYLPIVYEVSLGNYQECYFLILEVFRLSGLIVSVLHLLALAINHYIGIIRPLHYAATVTKRVAHSTLVVVWLCPFAFFVVYFSSVPGQGFQETLCRDCCFLLLSTFRIVLSLLFFVPLLMMTVMYVHIYFIVKQHTQGLADYSSSSRQLHKNVKAVITTLLILGTYLVGWMPAVIFYLLTCLDCPLPFNIVPVRVTLPFAVATNSLVVVKSFVDPVIYVVRMPEVKTALRRMWQARCGCRAESECGWEARPDSSRCDTKRIVLPLSSSLWKKKQIPTSQAQNDSPRNNV